MTQMEAITCESLRENVFSVRTCILVRHQQHDAIVTELQSFLGGTSTSRRPAIAAQLAKDRTAEVVAFLCRPDRDQVRLPCAVPKRLSSPVVWTVPNPHTDTRTF